MVLRIVMVLLESHSMKMAADGPPGCMWLGGRINEE